MKKTYSMRPLRYNSILWISGVATESDVNVTDRITGDIETLCKKNELCFDFHQVRTPDEFFALMSKVAILCKTEGYRPIIHLDFHGSEKNGLELSHTSQNVSWGDLFDAFRAINTHLENDLFVVAGVCSGLEVIRNLSIDKVAPFNWLLAPPDEIKNGELEPGLWLFYSSIIKGDDIEIAQNTHLPTMKWFYSERFLAKVLTDYYIRGCVGLAKRERLEQVVSDYRQENSGSNELSLSDTRRAIKAEMKATTNQSLFDKYALLFLLRKDFGFNFDDLQELLHSERVIN